MSSSSSKKKITVLPVDNSALHRRTKNLFKNRKKIAKKEKERKLKSLFVIEEKPKLYRPSLPYSTSGSSSSQKASSKSPKQSIKPSKSTKLTTKDQIKEITRAWPPPRDTNYSQVSNSVPESIQVCPDSPNIFVDHNTSSQPFKFVDCNLCGKKNLSSLEQLRVHQASKNCINRRYRFTKHRCTICQVEFDNLHNLEHHICRLN